MRAIFAIATVMLLAALPPGLAHAATLAEQTLIKSHDAWITAINAGDNKRGLGMMTEDAALIGPKGPIVSGKADVTTRVTEMTRIPGFKVDFTLTSASVSPDGLTGYVVGDSSIWRDGANGQRVPVAQRLVTVWRKTSAGWMCYLDIVMPN